ncbi:MAG TPA: DUF1330 domain-containing protein [Solirubrobacteraceae bacterium]|nr:DUF1330 domain-containing protein [Solirubrobacteraceae bacterium]
MTIEPTPQQFQRLASSQDDSPVVMLNLLRFKDRADGIDADEGITGAEAYARYGAAVAPHLARVGGRVLSVMQPQESVIGPEHGEWDLVLLAEYPSRAAFLQMISDPGYVAVHSHRAAALADSRLIACKSLAA